MAYRATQTTNQQQYLDSTHILKLLNHKEASLCCMGLNSKRKRCSKVIARQNLSAAKAVIQKLQSQTLNVQQGYLLILNLATLTLCPGYHRDQAQSVSQRWFQEVDWGFTPSHKRSSNSNQNQSRQKSTAEREAEIRRAAEQTRREEARRQAQKEKAERASYANHQRSQQEAEAKRKAEETKRKAEEARKKAEEARKKAEEAARERLRRERAEKAERDRLRRE